MRFTPKLGAIINQKYRLLEVLGTGGWGVTYLAEDLNNKQKVALKALSLNSLSDWKQVELFEREAKVLKSLNHRAIPKYLEYFSIDTPDHRYFYLAQELAPGKSLTTWVKDGWLTTETEVKQIAEQLLAILIYLHAQKPPIIHRDLKPDNIIRREDGKLFLVDFGAVKNTYYSTLARGSTVVGTYGYIAPEQFIGQAKPASDLYGLGTTILFLLTHISPAELSTDGLQIKFRNFLNISNDFADWLETAIEPEIENRFSNAKEALAVLKGKQKNPLTINYSVSDNVFQRGIMLVIALLLLVYFQKWAILSRLRIVPENICDPEVMTTYLKQGGDPNAWRNDFDYSFPIVKCFAKIKNPKLLELFIEKGGDLNYRYWGGSTVWTEVSSPESALILFEHLQNEEKISHKKRQEITFLLLSKSKEIALPLIEQGANINTRDRFDNTLLHETKDKEVAILAINAGIDVNVKNKYGSTPFHHGNSPEVVELLIEQGANVDEQNNQGLTPLHLARDKSIAQVLIDSGANLTLKDNQGNTPLHLHSASEYEIAQILIDKGVDPNLRNNQGKTPLHLVDYQFIAQALINSGANLTLKDNQGNTPLHSTLNPKVASILIKNGVNPNIRNNLGFTKLHLISINEQDEINLAISLISASADVNFRDYEGKTPLHLAVINKKDNLFDNSFIELLLKAGADINLQDNEGKTSLDYAKMSQNQRLIDLLSFYNSNTNNIN